MNDDKAQKTPPDQILSQMTVMTERFDGLKAKLCILLVSQSVKKLEKIQYMQILTLQKTEHHFICNDVYVRLILCRKGTIISHTTDIPDSHCKLNKLIRRPKCSN